MSKIGSGYSGSITYAQSSGTVSLSTVYVRLTSSASNNASGNVCTSSGATCRYIITPSVSIASSVDDYFVQNECNVTATPTNGGGGPVEEWR